MFRYYIKTNTVNQELPYEIIARILSGEATAQERNDLELWKQASPENQEAYNQMMFLWENTSAMQFEPDTEKALDAVSAKLGYKKRKLFSTRTLLQIAAVLVVLIASGVYLKIAFTQVHYKTFQTSTNEKKTIMLEDGTSVSLNANSKLIFPEHFDDSIRAVTLEGEAYFDVHHNAKQPFIITAGESNIRVLGTAFIVRDRKGENEISVSVHRGKVAFSKADKKVILTIGEKGILDKKAGTVIEKENDNFNDLAWQTGMLTFVGTPLKSVVSQISEYYTVKITIEKTELETVKFSGQFYDKKIEEILKTIELATGNEFVKNGDGYIMR